MKRTQRFTFTFLLLTMAGYVAVSQITEARRYFPHSTGNTWRWYTYPQGTTWDNCITKDSIGNDGTIFVFYDNATSPRYKIDTLANVYQFVQPSSVFLWFKLAAQDGDSFYTWNNTYKVKVSVQNGVLFGHQTIIKTFSWYPNPPGTYVYVRQSLARDFGHIRTYDDLRDDNATGCIIDSVRYGSLVSVPEGLQRAPLAFRLEQNYPNPFNPRTTIRYSVLFPENIRLSVLDMLGKELAVLVDAHRSAGEHSVTFDAGDLASGIYFYKLRADHLIEVRKMILAK